MSNSLENSNPDVIQGKYFYQYRFARVDQTRLPVCLRKRLFDVLCATNWAKNFHSVLNEICLNALILSNLQF